MLEYREKLEDADSQGMLHANLAELPKNKVIEDDYPDGNGKKAKLVMTGSGLPLEYTLFHAGSSQALYVVHFNRTPPETFTIRKYDRTGGQKPFSTNLGNTNINILIGVPLDKFGGKIFTRDIPTYHARHGHDRAALFDTAAFAQHIQAMQLKSSHPLPSVVPSEGVYVKKHSVILGGVQWPVEVTSSALGELEKIEQRRPDGVLLRTIEFKSGKPHRIFMRAEEEKSHMNLIVELDAQRRVHKSIFIARDDITVEEEAVFAEGKVAITAFDKGKPKLTVTLPEMELSNRNLGKLTLLAIAVMPIEGLNLDLPPCPCGAEVVDLYETGNLRTRKMLDALGHLEVRQYRPNGSVFTYTKHIRDRTVIEAERAEGGLESRLIMREPGSVPDIFTTFHPSIGRQEKSGEPKEIMKEGIEFNADEAGALQSFTVAEFGKAGNSIRGFRDVPIAQWGDKIANDPIRPSSTIDTASLKDKMESIQRSYPLPEKKTPELVKTQHRIEAGADVTSFPDKQEVKNDYGGGVITYFWKGAMGKDGKPVRRCVLKYASTPRAEWNAHIPLARITAEEFEAGGEKLDRARADIAELMVDDMHEILSNHNQDILIDFSLVDGFDPVYAEVIRTAYTVLEEGGDPRKVLISGINGRDKELKTQLIQGLKGLLGAGIESIIQPEHLTRHPESDHYDLALTRREDYDEEGRKVYSEDYCLGKITGFREHEPKTGRPIQSKTLRPEPIITAALAVGEQVRLNHPDKKNKMEEKNEAAIRGKGRSLKGGGSASPKP